VDSAGPGQDSFAISEKTGTGTNTGLNAGAVGTVAAAWIPQHEDLIAELEEQERLAMWDSMKECLDSYAELGNVQMCAAIALAAHEQLQIPSDRLDTLLTAYMGKCISYSDEATELQKLT
jgi:hypothetical protein